MTLMMTIVTSVSAMTYSQAKDEALFLADKMAYELSLTDEQYEAAYEINLDYIMAVNDYNDLYGSYWTRRNLEMKSILSSWQYDAFITTDYFYRPLTWNNNRWTWRIYTHYSTGKYYKSKPRNYTSYKGGHDRDYYTSRTWNKPANYTLRMSGNGSTISHNALSNGHNTPSDNRNAPSSNRNITTQKKQSTTSFGNLNKSVSSSKSTSSFGNRTSSNSKSNSSFGNKTSSNSKSTSSFGNRNSAGSKSSANTQKSASSTSKSAFGGHR